jgi:hemerythrin
MAFMTWNDTLAVGVKAMDDQHKMLVKAVNDLFDAMSAGKTSTVMGPLLTSLVDYTHYHFAAEEAMLLQAKYPALTDHRGLHKELTKQVEDYVCRFKGGEIGMGTDLIEFLRGWLTQHIKKEDRPYGQWLNQHGVH